VKIFKKRFQNLNFSKKTFPKLSNSGHHVTFRMSRLRSTWISW